MNVGLFLWGIELLTYVNRSVKISYEISVLVTYYKNLGL